ncbi:putative mitochondrial protein AtMg00860 [Castanea sativa]|uniref:putative mitochondrial protein AtMg00860 n=1 Tax=Castanea sativa TaxID=21020 RepID=UPI003F652BA8
MVKDRYPIPTIDELLDELHGAAYFTKLDLKSKYHQIRVQLDDVHKTQKVEYLGHIISEAKVLADPTKICSMEAWPTPTNITALRGFLRLTRYYRKFIRNYGSIAAPLTKLLKKDAFHWNVEVEEAFQNLKKVITQALVLSLPKFSKQFVIEADASGKGLGAVLMQEGQPVAFYSKAI